MIGDLVMSPTITPELRVCRIVDVNGNRDCVGVYDIKDEDEYLVGKYAKYLEPIPLTPEILEKNGFEQNENVKGYQYPNDYVIFCLEELSGVSIFNGVYNDICINCVHELQHVLRLCGLTELADNFKIV